MDVAASRDSLDQAQASQQLESFQEHRGLLYSIAYRMLGSVADAEDMLQETFLRWQQTPPAEIRSARAFLTTIITRLCINHLQSARIQREEYVGQWLPEPLLTSYSHPFHEILVDYSLSLAFLVLLERLNPVERAVFLLREIFDFEYSEIAAALQQTEANCRQIFSRARQHLHTYKPRFPSSDGKRQRLLEQFLHAVETGDVAELLAILSDDVVLHADGGGKGVAVPNLLHGADHVGRGVLGGFQRFLPVELVRRVTPVNGQPGLVNYHHGKPHSVLALHIVGDRIQGIYVVTNPTKLKHLPNLPALN
jgi:RNA polymerase sigma-70 factor, ECF subfamily